MFNPRIWGNALLLMSVLACNSPEDIPNPGPATQHAVIEDGTPIGRKFAKLGGAAVLGSPTTDVLTAPNGDAYRRYTNGVIVYSVDWGAVLISNPLFDKWLSLQASRTASNESVFHYIGSPIRDSAVSAGVETGTFERGIILAPPTSAAYSVYGEFYTRYHDAAGLLGLPLSEQSAAPQGGRVQTFEKGDIYWHPDSGAHALQGPIRSRWVGLGGASAGGLGYPISEEFPVIREGSHIGWATRFTHGTIYFSGSTGAWEMKGELLVAYEKTYGGASGWLGLPVGPTGQTAAGTQYIDFQNGLLVKSPLRSGVWAFQSLDLYWQRMQGYGDDCIACGALDIYVNIWKQTPTSYTVTRYPEEDECSGGCDIVQTWPLTSVARHDFFLDLNIQGMDFDDTSDDDELGFIHVRYDVDNLFGIFEKPVHRGENTDEELAFDIDFSIRNPIPYDTSNWVRNLGWSFPNFSTPELTYDQFAATFRDVAPDESAWFHPFNRAYYELVYKGVSDGGNCFGMSLTSVYAQKNELLWSEPIFRFPKSDAIVNEVNIKHGFQVGGDAIDWFVGQTLIGATHDPKRVFELTEEAYNRGDYPVIGFTTEYFGGSAHAVRPIRWERGPGLWKMIIYDNNYPGTEKFIEIDPDQNTFKYGKYAGGSWTGGRLFYYPFHVLHGTPRTPFWEVAALVGSGMYVLLGETGQAQQISDGEGHTFYDSSLTTPPTRWDEIRRDGRVPDLARLTLSDTAEGSAPVEMYYGKATGRTYQYQVGPAPGVAAGTPYDWTLHSGTLSAHLSVPATPGVPDVITVKNVGAHEDKSVGITLPSHSVEKRVALTVASGEKQRWAALKNVKLVPGQSLSVELSNGGYDILFENDGPETTGELVVQSGPGSTPVPVGTIVIAGGGPSTFEFARPLTTLTHTGGVPGNDGWFRSPITLTLNATDYSGKGIDHVEYKVDEGDWVRYTGPFEYAHQGVTTLSYRAKDKDGNQELTKTEQFKIDSKDPLVAAWVDRPSYSRTDTFIVHFSSNDPLPGSGLASTVGLLDGKPVENGQIIDLLWMELGTHTLTVTARDVAGGMTQRSVSFTLANTLDSLRAEILALLQRGEIDNAGIARSLLAKVDEAAEPQRRGDTRSTVNRLRALSQQVSAQSGKHLTERAATLLAGDIEQLLQQLE